MPISLLTTKLFVPPVRRDAVPRPLLVERLNAGLERELVLVSAPAGFGKTTLLSSWVSQSEIPAGWVSLDEGDNDPVRFFGYLIAALQTVEAGMGETPMAMLGSPQPSPVDSILTALINEIAETRRDLILVLDDYHLIHAPAIHQHLLFLLEHLPPQMHLVIATRSDPPLPLARLRGRGQLSELRSADLSFTADETIEFLNRAMGLTLSEKDTTTLVFRTEGWITGLHMAAVSMQGRDAEGIAGFIQAFSGSSRYILDYLVEEVLERQPQGTRDFMLHTSVLNRLSGPLCDAVTGQSNGQHSLEQLEQSNLFIVPLDDERYWYRYHHLFADLLRNQLHKTQPGLHLTLHRRASQWYEQEGLIPEAMYHAIATEDFDRAANLLESIVSSLLNESRPAELLSLMARLPDKAIAAHPWLCVHGAWAYFLTWQFDPIEPLLQAAELRLSDRTAAQPAEAMADETRIRSRIVALRAFMAQWQGDLARATALSYEVLTYLDEDDLQIRSVLETNLGDISVIRGDLVSARQHLERSITAGEAAGNFYAALSSVCRLAELETMQGRLHKAAETYRQAIRLGIEWGGGKPIPGTGTAHVGLAQVLYEWNDLDGAESHLMPGIRLGKQCGEQERVMQGYLALARLRQAQGRADAAAEALEQAGAIAPRDSRILPADYLASWQARIALAQGDLAAACRWADSWESALDVSDILYRFEQPCLALVRVQMAEGKIEEATQLLAQLLPVAETRGYVGNSIEMRVLYALALQEQGHKAQAIQSLEQALSLAQPGAYVRVFVDEGPSVARLLYEAAKRGIGAEYAGRLLVAFPAGEPPPTSQKGPREMVEPLSEREIEVLQLIAEGLSNRQVSQRLVISLPTVKWHTSNIYGKLGVKNRTQAVAQARALGILPTF